MNVLVVNFGSSSLKLQVISTDLERIKQDRFLFRRLVRSGCRLDDQMLDAIQRLCLPPG